MNTTTVSAPKLRLAFLELPRALAELSAYSVAKPFLRQSPRGDGHPVLVLPGFTADDRSTGVLRRHLDRLGYKTFGWDLGRNLGPRSIGEEGEILAELLEGIHKTEGRKVSLIGQSLGGVMAREVARATPESIRQVITLGSPFGGNLRANNQYVLRLYERLAEKIDAGAMQEQIMRSRTAPPVPCTSIYSKTDGIVAWQNCIETAGEQIDNIEIIGSHCGMGVHPAALYAIADRLAQAEDEWQPFERCGWLAGMYPKPSKPLVN